MKLSTRRLRLRYVTENDLQQVHALHTIPETDTYNTQGIPANVQESQVILQAWLDTLGKTAHIFLIETQDGDFVGFTGMKLGNLTTALPSCGISCISTNGIKAMLQKWYVNYCA